MTGPERLPVEAADEDVQEQRSPLLDPDPADDGPATGLEADDADAAEQGVEVPLDDPDRR